MIQMSLFSYIFNMVDSELLNVSLSASASLCM